jgi:hypothetical protein
MEDKVVEMLKNIHAILEEHAKQIQLLKQMIDLYHKEDKR